MLSTVAVILSDRVSGAGTATRLRHAEALTSAVDALEMAQEQLYSGNDCAELAAESLRVAIRSLDNLVGRIGVEDLLGEIFSSFCIGK